MKTVTIELKNNKALQVLKSLEDLNLLTIKDSIDLFELLKKSRRKSAIAPSDTEIQKMVKEYRAKKNAKKD